MKINTIVIFMVLVFSHLAYGASAQPITIKKKKAVLTDVFADIRKQTGFDFILPKDLLKKAKPVNVSFSNVDLRTVLDALMEGQPFIYTIKGKGIIISDRPAQPAAEVQKLQNQIVVKGTVTDSLGNPLAGATVKVRNTNVQTVTDRVGNFSLKGVPVQAIIEISYLGHQTQTIKAAESLNVVLAQSNESMKEVVVTGLFTRKAESFTGSTATFTQKELLQVGNVNLVKSLANLDPSFRIMENLAAGSDPNRLPDIQLRGQTGLPDLNNEYGTNPNLPLFILDGFETNLQRIVDLDMYLVKSITLLKDAASKAVYGSRAANGVVVIETLRPGAGALQITYNYNLNAEFSDLSSYSLANASQKLNIEMQTDPRLINPGNPYYNGNWFYSFPARAEYDEKLEQIIRGVDTDWLPEPLRNGFGQRHSLNLGGGRDELRYYVELGYNDIQGVMKGSERKAYSGGIQLAYRRGNVSVNNILRHAYSRSENSPYGNFQLFAQQNPYLPARNVDGSFPFLSPLYNGTVGVQDFAKEKSVTNNTELIWNILPELRFNGRVSFSNANIESDQFLPATHNSFAPADNTGSFDPNSILRGSYVINSGLRNLLNTTLTLSYNRVFNKHAVYANIGGDANSARLENYGFKVVGFPNQNLNFPAAALQFAPNSRLSGTENLTRDMGFYSAVNYTFNDRYLADVSLRRMRSSQFGSENPSTNFWSAGLGWNIHKESFMESLAFINTLRLTANTGYTGSQPLQAYVGYPVYRYQLDNLYLGEYPLSLTAIANPLLGAQRKQDHNFSLITQLMDKRLNVNLDYYISTTDGLLVDINLPRSTGFASYKANQGTVENRGLDLRLNYQLYQDTKKGNFVSFYGTMGHNKNVLKKLSNSLISLTSEQDRVLSPELKLRFQEGTSLNTIWAVPSRGIDPATGREVFIKKDGSSTFYWDPADQVAAGDAIGKLYGNFGFSLRYEGWQLNTSFAYNWGGQKYNATLANKVENIDRTKNVDARVFTSRWQKPGDQTFFKGLNDLSPTYPTTRFVEDWNEITMANANISYDLDRLSFVKRSGIRRLRVSLVADNAFVLSSMRLERGTEYPFARTYSFTLQTNF